MTLATPLCVWEKIDNGKNSVSRKTGGSHVRLLIYSSTRRMQGEPLMPLRSADTMASRILYFKTVCIKLMVACIRYVPLNGLCSHQETHQVPGFHFPVG